MMYEVGLKEGKVLKCYKGREKVRRVSERGKGMGEEEDYYTKLPLYSH